MPWKGLFFISWTSKEAWMGPGKVITHDSHQFLSRWPRGSISPPRFTVILHSWQGLERPEAGTLPYFKFAAVSLLSNHRLEKDSCFWGNLEPKALKHFFILFCFFEKMNWYEQLRGRPRVKFPLFLLFLRVGVGSSVAGTPYPPLVWVAFPAAMGERPGEIIQLCYW